MVGTQAELGIREEGKAANEHLTDAITAYRNALEVAAYHCALEVYAPESFSAYHVRVEANLAKSRGPA